MLLNRLVASASRSSDGRGTRLRGLQEPLRGKSVLGPEPDLGHRPAGVLYLLPEDGPDLGSVRSVLGHPPVPLPVLLQREECRLAVLQTVSGKKTLTICRH